mgnify:CR=1 FL=1
MIVEPPAWPPILRDYVYLAHTTCIMIGDTSCGIDDLPCSDHRYQQRLDAQGETHHAGASQPTALRRLHLHRRLDVTCSWDAHLELFMYEYK